MITPSMKELKKAFIEGTTCFEKLASAFEVIFPERSDITKDAVSVVISGGEIFLRIEREVSFFYIFMKVIEGVIIIWNNMV